MKKSLVFGLLSLVLALGATGCVSHSLPKDSYLRGVKSKVSTPWGSGELDVAEAATGTAAKTAAGLK